jgi:hypothetical protein
MYFGDSPAFWRNTSPSGLKNKLRKKPAETGNKLNFAAFFLGLLFHSKCGCNMLLWKVGFSLNYTVLRPR